MKIIIAEYFGLIPTISLSGENYTDQLAPDSTVLVGFESKIMHFFNEEGLNLLYADELDAPKEEAQTEEAAE